MITGNVEKNTSLKQLKYKNYPDYKRMMELYDRWDASAKNKDFYYAEHFEWMIAKIYRRNGIIET